MIKLNIPFVAFEIEVAGIVNISVFSVHKYWLADRRNLRSATRCCGRVGMICSCFSCFDVAIRTEIGSSCWPANANELAGDTFRQTSGAAG